MLTPGALRRPSDLFLKLSTNPYNPADSGIFTPRKTCSIVLGLYKGGRMETRPSGDRPAERGHTMIFSKHIRSLAVGAALLTAAAASYGQLAISVRIGPPVLPVYAQPICPGDGYIWTPGYWAYGPEGYYWIPGTWVLAPTPGYLWTPAYWGWENGFYHFHEGYWGPHIGFYGGINYGFGYFGSGFEGGEWRGNHFFYNTAYGNFGGAHITNVYVHNVTVVNNYNHVSFNGGTGGVQARPQPAELAAMHENHVQPTAMQQQHFQAAAQDRGQLASVNGGRPQMTAARTPQEFTQHVNSIPQTQRVAPGAPGERFHPTGQPAGQPNNQMRQPNTPPAQNRMQPAVPPQQRMQNQPQPQQQPHPQAQPQLQQRPQQAPPQQPHPQAQPQQHPAAAPAPHEAPREEHPR